MKARASPGPRGLDSWSSSPTESQYREVGGGVAHVGSHVHSRTRAAMSPGRTASGEEARLVNALRTSSGRGGGGGSTFRPPTDTGEHRSWQRGLWPISDP